MPFIFEEIIFTTNLGSVNLMVVKKPLKHFERQRTALEC